MIKTIGFIFAVFVATAQELPRHGVIGLKVSAGEHGPAIDSVAPGSAGEAAGFQAGDVIKELNGAAIAQPAQFVAGIGRHLAGDAVKIGIVRGGQTMTLSAVLKPRPRESSPYADIVYTSVEVRGARRSAILTRPKGKGRLAAVLLMQGLGCYSVDNLDRVTGYGRVIAEFEKNGFVTMRLEKTGEGDSEGPACEDPVATPDLEAEGYVRALRQLKSLDYVDASKIFVFAHSMGPVVGSMAIAWEPVAGFIAVETVGKTWFEYDLERFRVQADLGGKTPDEVERRVREYQRCSYGFYVEKQTPEVLERTPGCAAFTEPFGSVPYQYMQRVADIDLAKQWKNADFPVLVVYGTASPVTTAEENRYLAALINRLHPGRAQYAEVAGMGHDFNRYASQAEYMQDARKPGHAFNEGLFETMMPWLKKKIG